MTLLPDMLYGAILRCPHPHAQVKSVDTSLAEKMPGVLAVITGGTPGAEVEWGYGLGTEKKTKLVDPLCRHEGEEVAAVAAETPYQAWDAVGYIRVEYEVLPFVADEREALQSGAPAVHPGGNRVGEPVVYVRGDVEEGFAEADVVLEKSYRTESEIHTPMGSPRLRRPVGRRPPDRLGIDPGGVRGPVGRREHAEDLPLQCAGDRSLHGRRFREQAAGRQIHHHRRAAGEEDRPSGQALPHPGRNLSLCRQSPSRRHETESRD